MPLKLLPPKPLLVDVSNITSGSTTVKQRARLFKTEIIEDLLTGEVTVRMSAQVLPYAANAQGGYGDPLSGAPFASYGVQMQADNHSAVDALTGSVLYQLVTETSVHNITTNVVTELPVGLTFLQYLDRQPESLCLQGQWFAAMLDQPIAIRPLQQQFILLADTPGYHKFSA